MDKKWSYWGYAMDPNTKEHSKKVTAESSREPACSIAEHELQEAEEIIHALRVEIAGKNSVIKALHEDIAYYRKDWKDQMTQDQG
jgi:hypothetical protein